jgi:tRNA A22 N-methylase
MRVRLRDVNLDVLERVMDYAYRYVASCRLVCRLWFLTAKGKELLSIVFSDETALSIIAGLGLQKMVG